jgi:hypothetical protein
VKAPKQNCPRCNSVQSFRPQRRDTTTPDTKVIASPSVIEVYIKCTVCNWESVLRKSTREIELLMANERRVLEQARIQKDRHGTVNNATARILFFIREGKRQAREEAGL